MKAAQSVHLRKMLPKVLLIAVLALAFVMAAPPVSSEEDDFSDLIDDSELAIFELAAMSPQLRAYLRCVRRCRRKGPNPACVNRCKKTHPFPGQGGKPGGSKPGGGGGGAATPAPAATTTAAGGAATTAAGTAGGETTTAAGGAATTTAAA
ncbi:unnamed protein product [Caenorhabditis auriculariae]|uniref:Uncharacterized protein n=1 Tax=Caenorhabditis auriculariae TaxID=2777116 RepID=A0A8S1HIB6_9PELO|nr:unnamed protein product [Caenorhabditis auriculariae]